MPEIQFKGKEFVFNHHLSVPFRPLLPSKEKKSIGAESLDGNLVIHGDNLHALKALLPMYAGKVDCIFIDPPYNTGSESWSYNDNVNSPLVKDWLSSNPVNKEDMLRHDKWLSMMFPRVRLLHELLSDFGSFWMTLDDNEIHRARSMLDEIFGESNFIGCIVWEKTYTPKSNSRVVSNDHDYIMVYAKQKSLFEEDGWNLLEKDETQKARYSNTDNDPRGPWRTFPLDVRTENAEKREKYRYKVTLPSGRIVKPADGRHWSLPEETFQLERVAGRIYFGVDGNASPTVKAYLKEGREGVIARTWWPYQDAGGNQDAKQEILEIIGSDCDFITPKPVQLIERILKIATNPQSIVLDSFAGSGTTGHAVLSANQKDGGNRKFILVECESYADALTAERIRRVINGYSYKGKKRISLYTEKITFTSLKKADKILDTIKSIENLEGHKYDKIKSEIKKDTLTVYGEVNIDEKIDGLGGSFTFCTLGDPIDIDKILTGESLPPYEAIGAWLYHTATGEALEPSSIKADEFFLGESSGYYVWLIYQPSLDFLKSRESALTLNFAEKISQQKGKKHLVFAPAKYVPNKTLLPLGVEYAPLPFALYRVEK